MKNQQVFPVQNYEYDEQGNVLQYQNNGMTLIDYFAAQAMIGMLTAGIPDHLIANKAYQLAKAMLDERENAKEQNNEY